MMRLLIFTCMSMVIVAILPALAHADDAPPPEAIETARSGIISFLNGVGRHAAEKNGYLKPNENVDAVRTGEGYAVFRIEPKKVLETSLQGDFESTLTFIAWAFPVYVANELRTTIRVSQQGGRGWRLNQVGGNSEPVERARSRWTRKDGYTHAYVFMINGPDFVMMRRNREVKLCSFRERNEHVLGIVKNADGSYPLLEARYVLAKIKPMLEKHAKKE